MRIIFWLHVPNNCVISERYLEGPDIVLSHAYLQVSLQLMVLWTLRQWMHCDLLGRFVTVTPFTTSLLPALYSLGSQPCGAHRCLNMLPHERFACLRGCDVWECYGLDLSHSGAFGAADIGILHGKPVAVPRARTMRSVCCREGHHGHACLQSIFG
jgi:hypothetical protein